MIYFMIDKVSCKNNMMEQQINYIVQCNVLWFIWEFQECSQLSQVVHPVLTSNYARPLPLVAIPHHDVAQHYENDVLLTPTLSVILNLQFWKMWKVKTPKIWPPSREWVRICRKKPKHRQNQNRPLLSVGTTFGLYQFFALPTWLWLRLIRHPKTKQFMRIRLWVLYFIVSDELNVGYFI